jgi:hypothetical protein
MQRMGSTSSSRTVAGALETWACDNVRCVIRFLWVRRLLPTEIHRQCGMSANEARSSEVTERAPKLMMAPVGPAQGQL